MENSINKPKLAFIIDTKGWALHNIAKNVKEQLDEYYDIDIIPGDIFHGNMIKLFILCKEYDLIHFFWRGYLSLIDREEMDKYIQSLGMEKQEFIQEYILNKNITITICDHLYLNGTEYWRTEEVFKYCKNYFVSSSILKDIYTNQKDLPNPYGVIQDGVNLDLFKPNNLERFNDIDELIIGWVGNSKFNDLENDDDLKGVRGIIKPAINELIEEGYKIKMNLADRNEGIIPIDKMPEYYNSIHLYVCASKTEGTPDPILEAMACGVPVISTDVGIVREVLGDKQKNYILKERSKEELKNKIKEIINNKEILTQLSKENLEMVKNCSWEERGKKYKKFFEDNLKTFDNK